MAQSGHAEAWHLTSAFGVGSGSCWPGATDRSMAGWCGSDQPRYSRLWDTIGPR